MVGPANKDGEGSTTRAENMEFIDHWLDTLGWVGHLGQMAQIDVNMLLNDDKTELRQDLLDHYVGTLGVGSVLNNINTFEGKVWKISDFREAVLQIQATAKKYNRPPVIWGLDSVHGANYLYHTIITPQPINLAATFDVKYARQAGYWASYDTRRAGIPWLFSPLLGLSWSPHWSRVYETFGEDPVLVGSMARAMVEGIQSTDDEYTGLNNSSKPQILPSRAAACAKHWVGYSMPHNGHDRSPSWIPKRHLYQYFLPPWKQVLNIVDSVMEDYTEIDGVPNVANRETLTKLLRHRLQYDGMVVTDYHEVFNLAEWHHTASNRTEALKQALQEGSVDMSMIATEPDDYFTAMTELVGGNATSAGSHNSQHCKERVRNSARRVLELKHKLNMFDESFDMDPNDPEDQAGPSDGDLQAALEMTERSIILAENKHQALPLDTTPGLRVLVTGPTSNSRSFQSGGWTGQWQGINSQEEDQWFTYGSTILDGLRQQVNGEITYACGVDVLGNECQEEAQDDTTDETAHGQHDSSGGVVGTIKGWVGWQGDDDKEYLSIERAMNQAKQGMDVIVVCVGEENYTEKPGDIRSLELPPGQIELVAGLRQAAPDAIIALVYLGGRPRLLREMVDHVDAVLLGFLPGPLAGDAIVNILTGKTNPSAKLPITYPKFEDGGGIPYLHAVSDMCTRDTGGTLPHWENTPCDVQWPFGHGLSFTTFAHSELNPDKLVLNYERGAEEPVLQLEVTVKNLGTVGGTETVMFFTFDESRGSTPEYKRLRAFENVWLEPGTSQVVKVNIPIDDLRFVGPHDDSHYILEDHLRFRVGVGAAADCRAKSNSPLCTPVITVRTDPDYVGACEASCDLWSTSGCGKHYGVDEAACWDMCSSIHDDEKSDLEMNNDGWGWNYVECLESIIWSESFESGNDCWKLTNFCRDVLSTPLMDEYGHGATPAKFANQGSEMVLILALLSGVIASIMVSVAMRGGCKRKKDQPYGDVQFSEVHTHELMT